VNSDGPTKACVTWGHIGATWRIRPNSPCAMAMRPFCQITSTTCLHASSISSGIDQLWLGGIRFVTGTLNRVNNAVVCAYTARDNLSETHVRATRSVQRADRSINFCRLSVDAINNAVSSCVPSATSTARDERLGLLPSRSPSSVDRLPSAAVRRAVP